MITKVDHIGIAVNSLAKAIPYYENALGLKCEKQEEVVSQHVRIASFPVGEVNLELIEPTSDESPVAKFLKNNGEGIHHIGFASDAIEAQLGQAKAAGCRLIHETPIEGADSKLIAFLHPKSSFGVLTELCAEAKRS